MCEMGMNDIREIDGLWCDDITFCPVRCGWNDCPRNKQNIRDKTIPHSFFVDIPTDCPKKQEGREAGMRYFILRTFTDDEAETCLRCNMQELVRCKDCKYGEPGACGDGVDCDGVWHDADWFCAAGKRRDDDD